MLKFGMVGTNFVSDMFMEGVKLNPDVSVVSVCSGTYELASDFAKKYDIPNVYHDYKEMIEKAYCFANNQCTISAMTEKTMDFYKEIINENKKS